QLNTPMVCMYLLGNPDHYTDHTFVNFYWQSYQKGKLVGLSPVFDYIYRASELEDMSLYDWVRQCTRVKIPTKKAKSKGQADHCDHDSDVDTSQDISEISFSEEGLTIPDIPVGLDEPNAEPDLHPRKLSKNMFAFTKDHPLYERYAIRVSRLKDTVIPNIVGATLPRRDQGDREYYCSTMLTLFKPWRSGFDLKMKDMSWDDAFLSYPFSKRHEELMNNFNLRYECLDARDDYRAQLKKG
ncbi:hypothetical protein BD779DRAFT_1389003, partial [Infundibulicybe gibba]